MKYISLNPTYVLKPDIGKTYLVARDSLRINNIVKSGNEFVLHPIHASILNLINGDDYDSTIQHIASFLFVSKDTVKSFIDVLLDNECYVKFQNKKLPSYYRIPPFTIISSDFKRKILVSPDILLRGNADVRYARHETPSSITLMVNNKCATDCFYCYEDKRIPKSCSISLERIQQLIVEARNINITTFDVMGGEFFLYPRWKELLIMLHENEYYPFLSTKLPLDENTIKTLAELKITNLQISLDTMIEEHLCEILHVRTGYLEKIKKMFLLLNKYDIQLIVHSVLNSKNDSVDDIQSIYKYIAQFKNIRTWQVDVAGPSLYKTMSYELIKPNSDKLESIINYLKEIESVSLMAIVYPRRMNYIIEEKDKSKIFHNRVVCSGNYSTCFILPDGDVTICEQLYWNKRFIIGNVNNQSLMEVWNSKEALDLYYLSQKDIPQDSKCSKCLIYTKCRQGKGICWLSVIREYGNDKWYYPDPLCPQ